MSRSEAMDLSRVREAFAIPGVLSIEAGVGGFPRIRIENAHARAEISAYAGQVLAYRPTGQDRDLLFVSDKAYFENGRAIKGGIPVCWPWFGPDAEGLGRPDHGFVRKRPWELLATGTTADGATRVRLACRDDESTRALWPHPYLLQLEVTVGTDLEVVLTTHNLGDAPLRLTQALHTYFAVGDVRRVQLRGLENRTWIEKVAGSEAFDTRRSEAAPLEFSGPVNRIYPQTADRLIIDDPTLQRQIFVEREGSNSVVVWNPWVGQAAQMGDFGDDEYPAMLCVETANAADDAVMIAGGGRHSLLSRIGIADS